MGYHKGQGGRLCAVCRGWFAVQSLVKIGARYYCPTDAAYVRRRRAAVERRTGRFSRSGGL